MKDDLLEELLNTTPVDVISFGEEDIKLAPLLDEINIIQDESIRSFVRSLLFQSDSFWKIPSSFSGKYHPPDERTEGGNVLHTKRVVRIAFLLCRSQERTSIETDMIIAAALIHDITKGIEKDGNINYDPMHPYTIDHYTSLALHNDQLNADSSTRSTGLYIDQEVLAQILRLVHCHLGPFSPIIETYPITGLEWILHFADIVATHLHNIIDGDEVNDWRWIERKPRGRRPKVSEEKSDS